MLRCRLAESVLCATVEPLWTGVSVEEEEQDAGNSKLKDK